MRQHSQVLGVSGSGIGTDQDDGYGRRGHEPQATVGSGTNTITWASKLKTVVSFTYTETGAAATLKAKCKAVKNDTNVAYVTDKGTVIAKGTTTTSWLAARLPAPAASISRRPTASTRWVSARRCSKPSFGS